MRGRDGGGEGREGTGHVMHDHRTELGFLSEVGAEEGSEQRRDMAQLRCSQVPSRQCKKDRLGVGGKGRSPRTGATAVVQAYDDGAEQGGVRSRPILLMNRRWV